MTAEVERYELLKVEDEAGEEWTLLRRKHGDWVRYEDFHAALQTVEAEQAEKQLAAMEQELTAVKGAHRQAEKQLAELRKAQPFDTASRAPRCGWSGEGEEPVHADWPQVWMSAPPHLHSRPLPIRPEQIADYREKGDDVRLYAPAPLEQLDPDTPSRLTQIENLLVENIGVGRHHLYIRYRKAGSRPL